MTYIHWSALCPRGTKTVRRDQSKMVTFILPDGRLLYDWFDKSTTAYELFEYLREEGVLLHESACLFARINDRGDREFLKAPDGTPINPSDRQIGDIIKDHYVTLYLKNQSLVNRI